MTAAVIKAPFPWFGGKSRAASLIWERFGDVPNYVEPFAGSLAVLLGRPHAARTETVNDADCYLANFWRALAADPEAVARWADWPVNEADLHARHRWLIAQGEFRERMKREPDFFDAKIAGWWVWGLCSWIGTGWCVTEANQLPHLGNAGRGVHRKLPHLGNAGRGVHRKLPHLGNAGMGVHRKLQHLGNAGRGALLAYLGELSTRLRRVRVACGDWSRVVSESVTVKHGTTAVLLDPPYASERKQEYSTETADDAHAAREWALGVGDDPRYRVALCGYEGDYQMPDGWTCVAWAPRKGYSATVRPERIWFSPHCLSPGATLFDHREAAAV